MKTDFNFYVKGNPFYQDNDFKYLFGKEDEIIWLEQNARMPDALVVAGVYETKSKASKDGWNKPLPLGWYDRTFGKRHIRICIWNPTE